MNERINLIPSSDDCPSPSLHEAWQSRPVDIHAAARRELRAIEFDEALRDLGWEAMVFPRRPIVAPRPRPTVRDRGGSKDAAAARRKFRAFDDPEVSSSTTGSRRHNSSRMHGHLFLLLRLRCPSKQCD